MPTADTDGRGVVSESERRRFVEAVLAEKLAPDFVQVAYHFTGWLDSGAKKRSRTRGGTGGGIIAAAISDTWLKFPMCIAHGVRRGSRAALQVTFLLSHHGDDNMLLIVCTLCQHVRLFFGG